MKETHFMPNEVIIKCQFKTPNKSVNKLCSYPQDNSSKEQFFLNKGIKLSLKF